jgi:hypothetical protein
MPSVDATAPYFVRFVELGGGLPPFRPTGTGSRKGTLYRPTSAAVKSARPGAEAPPRPRSLLALVARIASISARVYAVSKNHCSMTARLQTSAVLVDGSRRRHAIPAPGLAGSAARELRYWLSVVHSFPQPFPRDSMKPVPQDVTSTTRSGRLRR